MAANIALDKDAYQSSTLYSGTGAEKAVDGLKSNLSHSGGQCAVSANEKKTALWRVDLGNVSSINTITIYYRTENVVWSKIIPSLCQRYILMYKHFNTNVQIIFRSCIHMRVKVY